MRELGDRLPATDELLTEIATRFREHNVEMAFNQMDIFVKNMQSQEAQLNSTALPVQLPVQKSNTNEPGDDA